MYWSFVKPTRPRNRSAAVDAKMTSDTTNVAIERTVAFPAPARDGVGVTT
jgi:hypothetical protein